ncbi:hypoxanthine-guanine phosphoribosyltransferase [Asimina triloba]
MILVLVKLRACSQPDGVDDFWGLIQTTGTRSLCSRFVDASCRHGKSITWSVDKHLCYDANSAGAIINTAIQIEDNVLLKWNRNRNYAGWEEAIGFRQCAFTESQQRNFFSADTWTYQLLSNGHNLMMLQHFQLIGRSIAVRVLNRESCSTIDRYQIGVTPLFRLNQSVKSSCKKATIYQKSRLQCCASATSGHPSESEPEVISSKNFWNALLASLDAFYRFSRPHTVIGTAIAIISVSLLAVERVSDLSPLFFAGVLEALVPALFMNLYIVGLNQLYDVDIDKINKPDLPLASGEYSVTTGTAIVLCVAVLCSDPWRGLGIGPTQSSQNPKALVGPCLATNKVSVSTISLSSHNKGQLYSSVNIMKSFLHVGVKSFVIAWVVRSWPLFWALFISFMLGTAYSVNASTFP